MQFDGTIIPTQNAAQKSSYTDAGIVASSSTMLSAPNDMANGKKDDLTVKKGIYFCSVCFRLFPCVTKICCKSIIDSSVHMSCIINSS